MIPEKIISGGQTGADRGALDAAGCLRIKTGGWAPKGYRTEKGPEPILKAYGLVETESREYPPRTRLNAKQSDGTAWFGKTNSRGYELTLRAARSAGKHFIANPSPTALRAWVAEHGIKILNVAGNRASQNPDAYGQAFECICDAFRKESVEHQYATWGAIATIKEERRC